MKFNRKNKILVLGLLSGLYICYAFAISNTVEYYKQYQSQKELIENSYNNPAVIKQFIQKEKDLNNVLTQFTTKTGSAFQNELLKQLTDLSSRDNLKIIDFKEPHLFIDKNTKTTSYIFSIEGSFNGMLLLINSIENNPILGSVRHITFIKKRNYKTNTDYLTSEIILQKNESLKVN